MKLLRFVLIPAVSLLLATSATAEKLSLDAISSYLNRLTTVQAEFTQINGDGTISTGEILIRRPGRVRFQYNPPDRSLVIGNHGQVVIFDSKSNQPPEKFPMKRTPLNLILAKNVNLNQEQMIIGHSSDAATTTITAQDPKAPEYGNIQMVFTGNPVELRQWIITDGSGSETTVILGELKKGGKIRLTNFDIEAEETRRGF